MTPHHSPERIARRSILKGVTAVVTLSALPAVAETASANQSVSCLPSVLYALPSKATAIAELQGEIARERLNQQSYFKGAERFGASLGVAATRICRAMELSNDRLPDIMLAQNSAWRTIDRHFSGTNKEVVLLSKSDTLLKGQAPTGDNMLFAILAHELGHAFQFSQCFDHGDTTFLTDKGTARPLRDIELHADYMAGFSLARAEEKYGRPEDLLRKFSDTIFNLGDFNFGPCLHHGIPAERYTMMMKGYIEAQKSSLLGATEASSLAIKLLDGDLRDVAANSQGSDSCE